MSIDRAVSILDLKRMARMRLPRMTFDYIEGGCDDEGALTESKTAFGAYRLLPRYLVDVPQLDTAVSIAGQTFSIPLGIAPTDNAGMFRHDADRLLEAGAVAANIPFILSGASNASIEEAMKVAPDHAWFQLYGVRDPAIFEDMIRRALDLGVKALVLTVDVPASSNRERNQSLGKGFPFLPLDMDVGRCRADQPHIINSTSLADTPDTAAALTLLAQESRTDATNADVWRITMQAVCGEPQCDPLRCVVGRCGGRRGCAA